MTEHTREEELEMMRQPERWPWTTVLPLARRTPEGKKLGFLWQPSMRISCPPPEPVVYLGDMFSASGKEVTELDKQVYASLEAVVDDGWEVD